jgi:hypothetical protein
VVSPLFVGDNIIRREEEGNAGDKGDVLIPNHTVSARHATLSLMRDLSDETKINVFVEDHASTNGVFFRRKPPLG